MARASFVIMILAMFAGSALPMSLEPTPAWSPANPPTLTPPPSSSTPSAPQEYSTAPAKPPAHVPSPNATSPLPSSPPPHATSPSPSSTPLSDSPPTSNASPPEAPAPGNNAAVSNRFAVSASLVVVLLTVVFAM